MTTNAILQNHVKRLLLIVLLLVSTGAFAQLETNNWYFGGNAGLSFKTGSAVAITDGKMDTPEGVSAISNKNGDLLFYTNGETIFNKGHNVMTNGSGLKGHKLACQSSIIVPQPGRGNRYYVFTIDAVENNLANGLCYSVVDTTLSSGYGAVVSGFKNISLLPLACERIAATRHANKVDVWIVVQHSGNSNIYAYLLSASGLNTTPVISNVSWKLKTHINIGYAKGAMKFSPDGRKMVIGISGTMNPSAGSDGEWWLFDFDNIAGSCLISIIVEGNLNTPISLGGLYGVEFSPNGRFLYVATRRERSANNFQMIQYDLHVNNGWWLDVEKSYVVISQSGFAFPKGTFGSLQLARDGKIYMARNDTAFLGIIEKPNCKGLACNYVKDGIRLGGKQSQWGLPTFMASNFGGSEFEFGDTANPEGGLCFGDKTRFWLLDTAGVDSLHWVFGDPASGSLNYSNALSPEHVFTDDTTFKVSVAIFRKSSAMNCQLDTASRFVSIFPVPKFNIGRDTLLCEGEAIFIDLSATKGIYLWHDNSNKANFTSNKSDTIWAKITDGGCHFSDTMILNVIPYPIVNLGSDTIVCAGSTIKLESGKADSFLWSTSSIDSAIIVTNPGIYWLKSKSNRCESSDTIVLMHSQPPIFNLGNDTTLCSTDSLNLVVNVPGAKLSYLWSSSDTVSSIEVKNTSGVYWALATDTVCAYSDTIKVSFSLPKLLDLGADKKLCKGDTLVLSASIPGATKYRWHDNTTASAYKATKQGQVIVDVFDGFCNLTDSMFVSVDTPIVFNLGNDTILCAGQQLIPAYNVLPNYEYKWNNVPNQKDTIIKTTGKYRLEIVDLPDRICKSSDSINVTFQKPTVFNLGRDTVLCLGQRIFLKVSNFGFIKSTIWHDGQTGLSRNNDPSTVLHWLEIDNGVCTSRDSILISYKPPLSLNLGPDVQLCDNKKLDLFISNPNATSYQWRNGGGTLLSTIPAHTITSPGGTYIAIISDGVCIKRDTVQITYYKTPLVDLGTDQILCDQEVVNFDFSDVDADTFIWQDNSSLPTFQVTNPGGKYSVIASKGICADSASVVIGYTTAPDFDLGWSDTTLCEPTTFNFDFSKLKHTTFLWNDGDVSPEKEVTENGTHWLVATNICGMDSFGFNITVDELGCFVVFPNAFSPNGDGLNDMFHPVGRVHEYGEMQIYNRYGELIFSGPPEPGWDGNYGKDNPVMPGVYYWKVSYRQLKNGHSVGINENGIVHVVK